MWGCHCQFGAHCDSLEVCPGRQHQRSEWCATEPGCGAVIASSEHIALLAEQQEARKVLAAVVDKSSGEAGSRDGVCQHFGPGGLWDELLAAGLACRVHHEGVGQLCIICQLHPCSRIRGISELAVPPPRGWAALPVTWPSAFSLQSDPPPHATLRQTQAAQKLGRPKLACQVRLASLPTWVNRAPAHLGRQSSWCAPHG